MSASRMLRLTVAALSLAALSPALPAQTKEASPTVTYWSAWADKSGATHQTRCGINDFKLVEFAPPAAPEWIKPLDNPVKKQQLAVQPVGWTGAWHKNPAPQWIIPLSGHWYVETTDGTRVEMGPGEMAFGGDLGAKEIKGRTGHTSGTVGDKPVSLMIIQLDHAPSGAAHESCPAGGTPL